MNPALYRTLWRIKHVGDRNTLKSLRQVERNQWLSADELAALAWKKQRKIVAHAYNNCPYYRRKYDAVGFKPGDLRTPEDFTGLPVLAKDEVREHIEEMVASGIDRPLLVTKYTGGSTGIPLKVYHDARAALPLWAVYQRTVSRWGIRLGDKTAHIWGLNRLNQDYLYDKQPIWRRTLQNYVLLDAFDMTEAKMSEFAHLLRGFRPPLLIGYTSAMTAFAQYLEASGGAGFTPQAIWLTSEPTHDFQRKIIERVFGATVYDQYGSVEIFHCAAECARREGLHIEADFRTVEVVDAAGRPLPPGEPGQVVVTDLVNLAMPLIRYRNEDISSLQNGSCSCGTRLPLMTKVTGRIYDMFVLPDGTQVYGHRFTTFFYDHVDKVKSFQVHQTAPDQVIVRIVPTDTCDRTAIASKAQQAFKEYTRGLVNFNIRFVAAIPTESSGKYRFAKSDVSLTTR